MKFVYIGDPHERPTAPKNRTDDYFDTYTEKVNEIKSLVKQHDAKAILQPGDFLDAPKYDNAFLMEIVNRWSNVPAYQLLSSLQKGTLTSKEVAKELEQNTPIIGAIGNHELFGNSLPSYPRTSLAFLEQIGFMLLPSKEEPVIFTDSDGTTIAITATHYHSKIDTDAFLDDYIVEKKLADFHIHMVHGYLTNRDMGDLFKHTTLDKIAHETQADLTIAGHDHIGFPLTEVDGKWFVNPGSMTRTKNDLKEIGREPKALVIEVTAKNGVVVTETPLASAKAGKDVLSREALQAKAAKTAQMEEIKSVVNQAQVKQGTSISSIIKNIGAVEGVEQSVVDEVLELVTLKMEDMKPSQQEQGDPYAIKKLTLENFQSHKHSEMELSEGLNVIVGESSHGKSSIYRALNWLYDNGGANPRTFIKKGETFAKVTVELSNGYLISRVVEKKASGKNGYEIFNPVTKEIIETNTRGVTDVRNLLGFHKVPLDGGKELDINFMGQGESWFFIGKHVTSSERAKIIGSIFGTHYTDAVLKDMEGTLKKTDSQLKGYKEQQTELATDIKGYNYLEDVELKLKQAQKHIETIQAASEKKERIAKLMQRREVVLQEEEDWQEKLDSVKKLDQAKLQFFQLQQTIQKAEQLEKAHRLLEKNQLEIAKWSSVDKQLEGVSQGREKLRVALDNMRKVETLTSQLERYNGLDKRQKQIVEAISTFENIVKQTKKASMAMSAMKNVKEKQEKVIAIQTIGKQYKELNERIELGQGFLAQQENELNTALDAYETELSHAGTCPTCFSSIDTVLVKQVVNSLRA